MVPPNERTPIQNPSTTHHLKTTPLIFHQDPTSTLGPDRQVIMGFSRSLPKRARDFNFVTLNLDDVSDISAVAKNILKTLDVTLLAHQSDETEFMVREDIVFISRVVEAKYLDGKLEGETQDLRRRDWARARDR
ncbi:hypothetical protein DID88_010442 [Monilinia fructigena]|uniref:Uncharacterized protein n=1 Tax=Monilinia fructigena TaxID=38457 RepID=A0A395IL56_9HELO|nr:hypothetical protein DID88_010442 [Monilinia fructigena]